MGLLDVVGGALSGEGFLGQVASGFFSTEIQKDFRHASSLVTPNGLALSPNMKFLFHVYFDLYDKEASPTDDLGLVGALVKNINLPSFKIEAKAHNQYNRVKYAKTKIGYQPITIKMHADSSDVVRSFLFNYYAYHFNDPTHARDAKGYLDMGMYDDAFKDLRWGLNTNARDKSAVKKPFLRKIQIFGMSRGKYVLYELYSPIITGWTHDSYDYSSDNGTMEHDVTLEFEAVKYFSGAVSDGINGFAKDGRYDTQPSPLGKPGSTASLFGQGGLQDAGESIFSDIASGNFTRAFQTAGRTFQTVTSTPGGLTGIVKEGLGGTAVGTVFNAAKGISQDFKGTNESTGVSFPAPDESQTLDQNNTVTAVNKVAKSKRQKKNKVTGSVLAVPEPIPEPNVEAITTIGASVKVASTNDAITSILGSDSLA